MEVFLLAFLSLIPFVRNRYNDNEVDLDQIDKIVGGGAANPERWKFLVGLRRIRNFPVTFCGGTMLTPDCVVTAAHCIYDANTGSTVNPKTLSVTGGSVDSKRYRFQSSIQVSVIHPEFVYSHLKNDVAILRLTKSATFNDRINNISLQKEEIPAGTICRTAGWGSMDSRSENARMYPGVIESERLDILQGKASSSKNKLANEVELPVIGTQECIRIYKNTVIIQTTQIICTLDTLAEKDCCQGDSGGPLICNENLAGITSWGLGCATKIYPGVFTGVNYYTDWIEQMCNADIKDLKAKSPYRAVSKISNTIHAKNYHILFIQIILFLKIYK